MSATRRVRRGDGDRGAALVEFSVVIGVAAGTLAACDTFAQKGI